MALQVWLPLTKDLRQQGLSTTTITSDTATYSSSGGKLGGYYTKSFTVSSPNIATILSGYEFSVCFWIYINELPTAANLADTYVMYAGTAATRQQFHIVIRAESAGSAFAFCFYGDDYSFYDTVSDKLNQWMHVACLFKNNTQIVYVNGEKIGEREVTDKMNIAANSSLIVQNPHNRLNDLRIYDNCLTPEEVKKIAQGLVLHYPLNRQGWGQENLVWNSNWNTHSTTPPEGWVNWGTPPTREIVTIDGKNWLHVISDTAQFQGYSQNWTKRNGVGELTANTKMTVSFTAKLATAASIAPIGIHWCNSSGIIITQNWTTTALTTSPKRYSFTYTTPADCVAFNIMVGDNTNTAHEVWVTDIKLEFGEIATPWCPNSTDELAAIAGINEAIEYDISGFENNGIRVADGNNLFKGTTFSSFDRSNFVVNSSTDWTAYLRYYNGNAANHSFSDGIDTITLNAVSNLGVAFVRKATDINLDSNSYYTISCEAMSTQTAQPLCIGLSYYNTSNAWVWRGGTNGTNFTAANTWQKFSLTFTPDADTQYICYCFTVVGTSGGTNTFKIRNCKLEKGSVATDWTPGVIQKYTSDTPKYQVSTEFNGTEMIEAPWNPSGTSSFTIAGWFYHNSGTTYYAAKNTHNTYICLEDGRFFIYPATGSAYVGYWTNTTNVWQHIVLVHDAIEAKLKLYVNGLFVDEVITDGTVYNSDILDIGGRQGTAQYNGNISDFRIYATALSAEDIQALYQIKNIPD